jgi:hypothetical protein
MHTSGRVESEYNRVLWSDSRGILDSCATLTTNRGPGHSTRLAHELLGKLLAEKRQQSRIHRLTFCIEGSWTIRIRIRSKIGEQIVRKVITGVGSFTWDCADEEQCNKSLSSAGHHGGRRFRFPVRVSVELGLRRDWRIAKVVTRERGLEGSVV